MKPRKAQDLRELTREELDRLLAESQDTQAKQRFQHALKQLQDTSYLSVLRQDIARMKTLISERDREQQNG